jgi:predicted GNAT family acetyltransferase
MSRRGPQIGVAQRGVAGDHLDVPEVGLVGHLPRDDGVARVELDEPRPHVASPWVGSDGTDDVPPLAGAHADDPDLAGGRLIEGASEVSPHETEPHCQRGAGHVVRPVPLEPVLPAAPLVHCGRIRDMSRLEVEATTDPRAALLACRPYLEAEPAERNVMLTLLHDRMATGTEGRYWWVLDRRGGAHGGLAGVAVQTPLNMFVGISRMSPEALDALVPVVVEAAADLPGVVGEAGTVAAFAGRFATLRKVGAEPVEGQRLYRLGTLVPPVGVPGTLRLAEAREVAIAEDWGTGFDRDTGDGHDGAAISRALLAAGRLYFWEVDGRPVATISRQVSVAGTARLSFVYTPPEHRRRGYAAACTAALSRLCLDTDATSCVLFTQLSNPTSNSVYQRIGFEPLMDILNYRFCSSSG